MPLDDLDISRTKFGEMAQRILDRAVEEARRRNHALLTNEHVFLAIAQAEWDMFADVMPESSASDTVGMPRVVASTSVEHRPDFGV